MAASTSIPRISTPPSALTRFWTRLRSDGEIAYLITLTAATAVILIVALLVNELWRSSALPLHKFGIGFLFQSEWDPNAGAFGALPFIYGTCVTAALALLIAIPIGVGAAIFLAEMAPPRLSNLLTFLIELLAAVPSVIYGLLGIFVLIPLMRSTLAPVLSKTLGFLPIFRGPFYGVSVLSAGIVLSIMVVPFIISVSREVLLSVPTDQREAALALGATRWETTWDVVIPNARTGIIGSVFLALARALGETMAVTMVIGNTPQISSSLMAPGYSIAAVIANEFTEATGDLYISSLIFLGLVLFGLTIVINGVARILIISTGPRGQFMSTAAVRMNMEISPRRRITNRVMLSLTGLCTVLAVSVLFFILGYILYHGIGALSWAFFTKLPKPTGETGGGMANAIVGSGKILLLATVIGVPIGFLAGVYISEYSGRTFAFVVKYVTDLLNGVPSIVIGIFAYALVVRPMKHFSTLAGGIALGIMMIPIAVRTTEEFLRAVPMALREGAMALGAKKSTAIFTVVVPAALQGLTSGMMLNLARVAGETAPLLFTALGNMYWSQGWSQPSSSLPVMIFQYAISPYEDYHQQAWAAGFVLLTLVLLINITARLVISRRGMAKRR